MLDMLMHIIFVKHYLNAEGLMYFSNQWFPKVHDTMRHQQGFISLSHESSYDYDDCVHVLVKFKDQATLESWGYSAAHDALVDALDRFRSKNYWEYAILLNEQAEVNWQKIFVS